MKNKLLLLSLVFIQLAHAQPERYAVVIHEIMADPTPVIGLPNAEYIELRNTSKQTINLFRWKIDNGTTTSTINASYLLEPDSLVLLCSRTQLAFFNNSKNTIGLTSFPSLSNEGDLITLKNAEGKTIHAVAFETSWYNSPVKANGGWSLEMIDPSQPCALFNWSGSTNISGGTPGFANSISKKLDTRNVPTVLQCTALNENTLLLKFDAPLDSQSLSNKTLYQFKNEDELKIISAKAFAPLFNEVELKTNPKLDSNIVYSLEIKNLQLCDLKVSKSFSIKTGLSKYPKKGDMVFNELLFDPLPGGSDFIEVINTSNTIINIKNILLSNRNTDGSINPTTHEYSTNYNLFPFEPIVLTTDTADVINRWQSINKERLLQMKSLPSMPDDDGKLLILNSSGEIIDEFQYDKYMHYPLLRNKEGVSLEKINYKISSQQIDNWHSASASENYATPTRVNSQFINQENSRNWIQIDQAIVNADNNGANDFLHINYQFDEPGTLLSIYLFNQQGSMVCKIVNNLMCGRNGAFNW
ncbi:MAG: hypothetical protein RL253_234, partial [Bacteroidota bacterium]